MNEIKVEKMVIKQRNGKSPDIHVTITTYPPSPHNCIVNEQEFNKIVLQKQKQGKLRYPPAPPLIKDWKNPSPEELAEQEQWEKEYGVEWRRLQALFNKTPPDDKPKV